MNTDTIDLPADAELAFIRHDMLQGTPEWFKVRAGIPTASEFDAIISPLWKARSGQGVDTYLAKKLAERWLGHPLIAWTGGGASEQGKIKEEEAIPCYSILTGEKIDAVGFVTTLDGKYGCSPDGLLPGNRGIEIKSPEAHTHCSYLLDGVLPKEYAAQVHGSMLVTGAPSWVFFGYCRNFPPLILTVERNEEVMDAMREAIDAFNVRLDAAYRKLCNLNGGPKNS